MTAIRDEEAEDLAYELRRRISPILGNAELALEEAFGPVTPEQREALEEIVGASEEVGTVIARAFEADDAEDVVGTDEPLPAAAPEDAPPIAVTVDDEFDAILVDQLERSGHEVLAGDPAGTPHHAVVDCGVPTRADLEAIRERAGRAETVSLTVVSTIDAGSLPALGVSAIVSPTAPAELIAEELSALVGDDVAGVAFLGPLDERFRETLAEVEGASVIEIDPSADGVVETIGASDADVAVLDADGGDLDDEFLAALRDPLNPDHLPLVAVGPPPTGGEWTAIPGHDRFAHRPLSTVELAGEVLIELSRSEAVADE